MLDGDELTEEQQPVVLELHNGAVRVMQDLAEEFNAEVRVFRDRQ